MTAYLGIFARFRALHDASPSHLVLSQAREEIAALFDSVGFTLEAGRARAGKFDAHPITATLRAGLAAQAAWPEPATSTGEPDHG